MSSPSSSHLNFIFQTLPLHEHHHQHNNNLNHNHQFSILNPFPPPSNPQLFSPSHKSRIFSIPTTTIGNRSAPFSGNPEEEDDLSDDGSQHGEKKRRLNMEQVRTLEKNFELGNKLEAERKIQLARSLGLQPRQVAIWFQNRRARWKTKQLEKDYDLLKIQLQSIEAENDALHAQNKKLQAQILALKRRDEEAETINLNKETEGSSSNRSENSSEINMEMSLNHNQNIQFLSMIPQASDLHCRNTETEVHDEQLSNLLCGMEDQNAFWPWPYLHNHH